ncbi:MAG: hypothetical protein E6Q06_01845 [Candidatus Moraniibacteriota bacterium]|nr:MAG: hypothetical protein E6Q06_01845 [Candidatus Moranbacteria bacterium]
MTRTNGNTQLDLEIPDTRIVKYYDSTRTYTNTSASFMNDGVNFTYNGREFVDTNQLAADNFIFKYAPDPNSTALQDELSVSISSSVSNLPWHLESTASAPTAALSATLNGDSIYATSFSAAQDLKMSATRYATGGLAYPNDYTIVLAGTFPIDQTASNTFFSLSGTTTIYPLSFGNTTLQRDALVYNLGEAHYIPYVQNTGIYVFRVSFTTAFTSLLDVFFNGHKVYTNAISNTLTAKSLGLGGLLSLGSSTNTASFSMSLLTMIGYAQALSDQQCISVSKALNFAKQVLPASIPYPSAPTALIRAPSMSATSISGSVSLFGTAPFDLHQTTPANQPSYVTLYGGSIVFPTYNLKFSGAQANMLTTSAIPARESLVSGTFAIAYLPNVSAANDNEILTVVVQSDSIKLLTRYVAGVHTFSLVMNGTLKCSSAISHVAGTNDELVLFLVKNQTSFGFVAVRVDSLTIVGSCAFPYAAAGNGLSSLTVGRTSTPTSVFTYFLGDMWFYPRSLAGYEYKLHTAQFKQLYNLPLSGSIFS